MTALSTSPQTSISAPAAEPGTPTVWGLDPTQLHDRFWASYGVQVVRQGERSEIVGGAELFLLSDPRSLVIFRISRVVGSLYWVGPEVLWIRLHDEREGGHGERVLVDPAGQFLRFERIYGGVDSRLARVGLTKDRDIAREWQRAADPREGWRWLRRHVVNSRRHTLSVRGDVYDRNADAEVAQFIHRLVQVWRHPDATIRGLSASRGEVWTSCDAPPPPASTRFVGPVWIGAGRRLDPDVSVVGPAVLWDLPQARPSLENIRWAEIEPTPPLDRVRPARLSSFGRISKRLFDIAFASLALLVTLPLYPLIMLAIWLEDGRPFFFRHRRESLGGRQFHCLKFRSMRRDAEGMKQQLRQLNQADGPQFYIERDPRLTHVGRLLRQYQLDELPQFINVLRGDMSIVGPRPSPAQENQFCPEWRVARLSVRPGITGLWQVKRTRRSGLDFQEWIRHDLEYVEKASWRLDLWIIWRTIVLIFRG